MASKKTKLRVKKLDQHKSFKLSKKRFKQPEPLPGFKYLFKELFSVISKNKRVFLGLAVLNALFAFVFIQGFGSNNNLNDVKSNLETVFGGPSQLGSAAAAFAYLIGTSSSSGGEGGTTSQLFLVLVFSLATIWAVRQVLAGHSASLKESLYKGMYPLIPYLLVIFTIALQLIPMIIGNLIYAAVVQNGLAANAFETVIVLIVYILLALLSAYLLTSSLFASYIVTLPDMTPLKSLRSARELVLHRRLAIWARILLLPLALLVIGSLIFIPLIIIAAPLAQILFLLASSFSLVIFHVYMYLLYRGII